MGTSPFQHLLQPMRAAFERPLTSVEAVRVAIALLLLGTAYCQIYCLIAEPASDGRIPLPFSMWWAARSILPPFVAFELSKRVLVRSLTAWRVALVAALLIAALALSVVSGLLQQRLFHQMAMPVDSLIANRLPALTLAVAAIAFATRPVVRPHRHGIRVDTAENSDILPPASQIDWIQAAGNYVEIHAASRIILLRMTLRQAAAQLRTRSFVQIHRSVIVNRDRIAGWDRPKRPRRVRLTDGTELIVGESYRAIINP